MQGLNYLVRAVDHEGFAPPWQVLGIPLPKPGQRRANLEERLGVPFLLGSTWHFSANDIGQTQENLPSEYMAL